MDQLDVELDVRADDLMVLRDVRRVDLLLLTAVVEFMLEVVVEVVANCYGWGLPPGPPLPECALPAGLLGLTPSLAVLTYALEGGNGIDGTWRESWRITETRWFCCSNQLNSSGSTARDYAGVTCCRWRFFIMLARTDNSAINTSD